MSDTTWNPGNERMEVPGVAQRLTCDRCGQTFECRPRRFNVMHYKVSTSIPGHNAPCGRGCIPLGSSYTGFTPHFSLESCERCGIRARIKGIKSGPPERLEKLSRLRGITLCGWINADRALRDHGEEYSLALEWLCRMALVR